MNKNEIFLGSTAITDIEAIVEGGFVTIEGERFYKISNYNLMPDFFMTLVSDANHWMFISSNGSLSAGRKNRDNALFPYYTEDKIHDYAGKTGSRTFILVNKDNKKFLWLPFSKDVPQVYSIERNIYKSTYGNKIIFEEINHDLKVCFSYQWTNSNRFGFVKKSSVSGMDNAPITIEVLDGISNILPAGIDYLFQNEYSNLSDAYKKAELIEGTGLGLFMLSSIPVDRAEPSESLNATTVWSSGLQTSSRLLSERQITQFKKGLALKTETDVRAYRGAYFVHAQLKLHDLSEHHWMMVAEINQSSADVAKLNHFLKNTGEPQKVVDKDIEKGTANLCKIVASSDGLQKSNEELNAARHFSNTLFNIMRGGIYENGYTVNSGDLMEFIFQTNSDIFNQLKTTLDHLPKRISNNKLIDFANNTHHADLIRICYEYLPLTFSRRHGDPSRPWNLFSIDNINDDGSPKLDFQGNWRDIFQNWEALSLSYPGYIENIISKFVNASTADGYNPYRIMRSGIDWESPDPDDPWAYIGYWSDHQVIYLQKLLELSENYKPGVLDELLTKEIFVYANVPYRIKSYQEIVHNPKDTVEFDHDLNQKINHLVDKIGSDGRLLMCDENKIYHVNLTEKILVTMLVKLSNFIPEAGIWLNTQRPEWNDANNALVGNGVSMVTLYYLRRFIKFWNEKFEKSQLQGIFISEEIHEFFNTVFNLFAKNTGVLKHGFSEIERRFFTNTLGEAGAVYRNKIYKKSFSGIKKEVSVASLVDFTAVTLKYIDQSILVNKRDDGLYHAYNLISFTDDGISIRYLYEMLEGQVSVLSSGYLTAQESLEVLDSLKKSSLFREDQYSYLLYPDRELPRFTEKNNIPEHIVKESKLLSKLIRKKNTAIVQADLDGKFHFHGAFRNVTVLENALNSLDQRTYGAQLRKEKDKLLELYEEMFDHQSFTGRSGTFYGYEGLGSIYWHMVSKLLLAVEECFFKAVDVNENQTLIGKLKNHYYEIKAGIGLYKSPDLYGAFPTDPYSHTPGNAGVKQPGMTGQVKEDIISRMGELGVRIFKGKVVFDTSLLNADEFMTRDEVFNYESLSKNKAQIKLKKDQLAFTLCQVPVIYSISDTDAIKIEYVNGIIKKVAGNILGEKIGRSIFDRRNEIARIDVSIKKQVKI